MLGLKSGTPTNKGIVLQKLLYLTLNKLKILKNTKHYVILMLNFVENFQKRRSFKSVEFLKLKL